MDREQKIDYVEFYSDNIERTKAFYTAVFGWKFEDYGPDYTSFQDGRIAGGFRKGAVTRGAGPLIVIYANDLAAAEARVRKAGGTITKEKFSFPGGSRFELEDPSGNALAIWRDE